MKTSRKALSALLAVVMLMSLMCMSVSAANSNTSVTVGSLTVSVDNAVEGLYFSGNAVKSEADNGYYPFSFSLIFSDRSLVSGSPVVTDAGGNVVEDGFHWAYKENSDGSYSEDSTTTYGLVTLPTQSASTVTITTTNNETLVLTCEQPSGGETTPGASVYAYLPAPGQFTNEGVTTGGWGDIYDSAGNVKGNSSTGVSLGYFGGYVVYEFSSPIANDPANNYGIDFIVYGNAFWGNSEPGCIQVSQGADASGKWTWYDIAGSLYYSEDTIKNASITYANPNVTEDAGIADAGTNKGTLAPVNYSGSKSGTITTNSYHKHSWFPLNVNYFSGRNGNAALDKADSLPFVSRTLSGDVTDTLTMNGVLLGGITTTSSTASIGFGYCDVHPNKTLGGGVAYNPYQIFASNTVYNSKASGTSGGDPIDISWAVDEKGYPVELSSIKYVRIYTGAAAMNGIFGEISTEVCGIAAATEAGFEAATTSAPEVTVNGISVAAGTTKDTIPVVTCASGDNITVSAAASGSYVMVNDVAGEGSATKTFTMGEESQIVRVVAHDGSEGNAYIGYIQINKE